MKKLLAILFLGLLWCNVGFPEIIKPFELWCKAHQKKIVDDDGIKISDYTEKYHIKITDDKAVIVGLKNLYPNLMRENDTASTKYSFSNIGYDGKSSVKEDGNIRPFEALEIDRTTGEARLDKYIVDLEIIFMQCTNDKPKLLF